MSTPFKTVGLLLADVHTPERAAKHGPLGGFFERWLQSVRPTFELKFYKAYQGELPARLDEADLFVITGSRSSSYDALDWIPSLEAWIRDTFAARKPLLGMCFGHQIIAQAMGGKVEKAKTGWGAGVQTYAPQEESTGLDTFSVLVQHQDQVVTRPSMARCVAGNDFCPNGVLVYEDVPVVTFQCHLEFTKALSRDIIESRWAVIGEQRATEALNSLEKDVNDEQAARWALAYLEQEA